jgi:hypothetical protein
MIATTIGVTTEPTAVTKAISVAVLALERGSLGGGVGFSPRLRSSAGTVTMVLLGRLANSCGRPKAAPEGYRVPLGLNGAYRPGPLQEACARHFCRRCQLGNVGSRWGYTVFTGRGVSTKLTSLTPVSARVRSLVARHTSFAAWNVTMHRVSIEVEGRQSGDRQRCPTPD